MSRDPDPAGAQARVRRLLDEAEQALDDGEPARAIALCTQVQALEPDHAGAWFVLGLACRDQGELDRAAWCLQQAARRSPDHSPCWSALALARFELLAPDEAAAAVRHALDLDRDNAEAWWVQGLIHRWRGDLDGARQAERTAARLAPEAFPLPPELDDDTIDDLVSDVLLALPARLRSLLSNVAIIVEDLPDAETCRGYDPPASPLDLLGTFTGASLMERSVDDPWSLLPGRIVLYRGNLERMCRSRAALVEQLRVTLFHEIGHFLGLNEDEVAERGLQ